MRIVKTVRYAALCRLWQWWQTPSATDGDSAPGVTDRPATANPSTTAQVVLAHTPFRRLAAEGSLRDRPVLVAGAGRPAAVAREYGFRQVVTMEALHAALPHSVPFAATGERARPQQKLLTRGRGWRSRPLGTPGTMGDAAMACIHDYNNI